MVKLKASTVVEVIVAMVIVARLKPLFVAGEKMRVYVSKKGVVP